MATIDQLAQALNLSRQRCYQLVAKGMPQVARGQSELGPCMVWYVRFLTVALKARETTDGGALAAHRVRLVAEKASKVAHENARRHERLLPTAMVRGQAAFAVTTLRKLCADLGSKVTAHATLADAVQAELDVCVARYAKAMKF